MKADIETKLTIDELSDNANRIRRNLLIFSTLAIFYNLSGASISSGGVSFYGVTFEKLDEVFIARAAFFIALYHFIHFFFIAFMRIIHIRIRSLDNNFNKVILPEIFEALKKNDKSLVFYRIVAIARVIIIEIGLPLILGLAALYMLWSKTNF